VTSYNSIANVYVIYYATYKGKTGHVGLAISEYDIYATEMNGAGGSYTKYDTVMASGLLYYDLWPDDDQFSVWHTGKNIAAEYYKLPLNADEEITLASLYDKGIPHKENYPADGILKIETTWQQDQQLEKILDSLIDTKAPFNARRFNCSDFVATALQSLLGVPVTAKEFIGLGWSSTPNKLYRGLKRMQGVTVVKEAGDKAKGSFIRHRVFYKIFNRKSFTSNS
jgi:hypothetical protein